MILKERIHLIFSWHEKKIIYFLINSVIYIYETIKIFPIPFFKLFKQDERDFFGFYSRFVLYLKLLKVIKLKVMTKNHHSFPKIFEW